MNDLRTFICALLMLAITAPTIADEITFMRGDKTITAIGEILAEADNGDILFLGQDGRLRIVEGNELKEKIDNDDEVEPLSQKEISEKLLAELPEGFRIHTTKNFVIAYNTERAYAKWIGGLYERLFRGFISHWDRKRKFKLNSKPKYPLVAVVFSTHAEYSRYVEAELGQPPGNMVAYYNLLSNRVAMYDLTSGLLQPGAELKNDRNITQILNAPNSLDMVATVVHEGTHQLMFNTGMQTRMSDTPLWINEGLAMFFETPDMNNRSGWRSIGQVNLPRLRQFRQDFNTRPEGAFASMLSDDSRFNDPATASYAYSEAWSFNYFLLNKHSKEYVEYLKHMSSKEPLDYDSPEERLAEFKQFLGNDLESLEREFLLFIRDLN